MTNFLRKRFTTNNILWTVFLSLLAVLLPHTSWAFNMFESSETGWFGIRWGIVTATAAAIAFEAMIAVLTHRLSKHIEKSPKNQTGWEKFSYQYLNEFMAGLLIAWIVSTLANLSHAVQFGQTMAIFAEWNIPKAVYAIAFGGILPTVSLTFAKVLSNTFDEAEEEDIVLAEAREQIAALKAQLKASERRANEAEARVNEIEERYGAISQFLALLFNNSKRTRIQAIAKIWPSLGPSHIASMVGSSAGYVSDVLKNFSPESMPMPLPAALLQVSEGQTEKLSQIDK